MKTRILVACLLGLLAGCCPQDPPKPPQPDATIYPSNPNEWHKEEWNGHVYVIWKYPYQGGIAHDPDCPFCKEAKVEED